MVKIEVKRERLSVTQGYVHIYVNGERIHSYEDRIELVVPHVQTYGEKIQGWASTVPDSEYILGLLYNSYDKVYHYSDLFKDAVKRADKMGETK